MHPLYKRLFFLTTFGVIFSCVSLSAQYLHVEGKKIIDKTGNEIILRGMGLGGWMLQEGYMLETNSFANAQHEIRAKIKDLVGEENTVAFYDAWYANHCTKTDIDSLASWGFNSVRLPMHYNLFTLPIEQEPVAGQNTWLEKGFAMTDKLLEWCEANQIYLILDLHAAPGGQGRDAAISDYDSSKPSLWESDANKQKTIALWKKLAERYANEEWIGGYDLINEPNWNFTTGANQNGCGETNNAPIRQLYVDITNAIREVDQNHIIYIEGNCWGNNYTNIFPKWDNNMVASFHKYWNYNDQGSIQFAIDMRNQQNLPVWLGESGENSNVWFANAIRLMENNSIGWAWWPMKKVGSVVNPLTIERNDGYNTLLNYWKNGGTKPTVDFAQQALIQLAENLKIENNIYRKDVIDAMFRQVNDASTIPFAENNVPGVIHLSDYDLGRYGKAYADNDSATYHVNTSTYTAWNSGWSYRNDGVDIEASSDGDANSNGFNVGWTQDGEWMQYTLTVDSSASYQVTLRYASSGTGAKVKLNLNGADITESLELSSTGGNQVWNNRIIDNVVLYKGTQRLRLEIEKGGANLGFLTFALNKKINEVPFKVIGAKTSPTGDAIHIVLNKKINASTLNGTNGFNVKINGNEVPVSSAQPDASHPTTIIISIDREIYDNDIITIGYEGDEVKATADTFLEDFTNLVVSNNLPVHFSIPGRLEAEDFTFNQGLQLETTTDTGGGYNVGYTNAGDYLDYLIRVPGDGSYPLEVRIACNSQAGKLLMEQRSSEGALLNSVTVDVPVTGGWQNWQTVKTKIQLKEGNSLLRVKIIQPEFNINWFRFLDVEVISDVEKKSHGALTIYPNPAEKYLNVELPLVENSPEVVFAIHSINGLLIQNSKQVPQGHTMNIYIGDLPGGMYFIELKGRKDQWRQKFLVKK